MPDSVEETEDGPGDATQQVIYAISHDLQAPARHIRSFLQLLEVHLGDAVDEEASEFVNRITDAVDVLQAKLESLTVLSRVTTRGVEPEPCSVGEVVDEALGLLDLTADAPGLIVDVDPEAVVVVDRQQLVQVIHELVGNSLKFCSDPVSIRISSLVQQDQCVFEVVDSGPGFRSDSEMGAFDLFRRFHHRTYPGTGTGLTVVQRILERHDAAVTIESSPDGGTTVQFGLPIAVGALSSTAG